jgi:hypothetical protein
VVVSTVSVVLVVIWASAGVASHAAATPARSIKRMLVRIGILLGFAVKNACS